MRLKPSQIPRTVPFFWMASIVYWEHVGWKRHEGGRKGDSSRW